MNRRHDYTLRYKHFFLHAAHPTETISTEEIENIHVRNKESPRRNESFLPKFHSIPPKFFRAYVEIPF